MQRSDWNELDFVSWEEFRQMAPSITQLEVSRIGKLLKNLEPGSETHSVLVKARYELRCFGKCILAAALRKDAAGCLEHLRLAIINLSFHDKDLDEPAIEIRNYILDRIRYVHDRIGLIY